jgi:hypothetical protein
MKKLDEIKAKLKKHAPELMVAGLTVAGSLGWVMAGIYAQKLANLEGDDPNAWPTIEVLPSCMKDVEEGATLKYRQITSKDGSRTYAQQTTLDEWPDEAVKEFANFS